MPDPLPHPASPTLRRRTFLVGFGGFAAFAHIPGLEAAPRIPESAWRELKALLDGNLLRPGDPTFNARARPQNLRYENTIPSGIALGETTEHVARCMRWVHKTHAPVAIRTGGHNYAGFSPTNGLLIDTTAMRRIQDLGSGQVKIDGGVINRQLYASLKQMNATITHGRCDGVGAAGFLLGGGVGFNMRRLGVGSDNMLATELVLADGTIATASPRQNDRIFWACQGGAGGNFGINTSFTLKVAPATPLTVFNLIWSKQPDDILPALLETLRGATRDLGTKVSVFVPTPAERAAGKDCVVNLLGQLVGSKEQLAGILDPVTKIAKPDDPKGEQEGIHEMPYWDGQEFLSEPGHPAYYQERSRFFGGALDPKAIAEALRLARALPANTKAGCGFKFFQTGGRMNDRKPTDTAFVHRGSDWLFAVDVSWIPSDGTESIQRNLRWQSELYTAMAPFMTQGAFQNFSDPSLIETWKAAYYGENYAELRKVKHLVDRHFVFKFPQAIPPL